VLKNSPLSQSCYLQVGGRSSIDEAMWRSNAKTPNQKYIPRKPTPHGIKAFYQCFQLPRCKRPVCIHVLPCLREPDYGGVEVLNIMTSSLPENTSMTIHADSFFTNMNWVAWQKTIPVTMAIGTPALGRFYGVFTHELPAGCYRVFQHDNILLSVWNDKDLFCAVSTLFRVEAPRERRMRGLAPVALPPLLSTEDTEQLSQLSLEGLKSLAKYMGLPTSGTVQQVVARIARRPVPDNEPQPKRSRRLESKTNTDDVGAIQEARDQRREELEAMTMKELRNLCKDTGVRPAKNKQGTVAALLKNEFDTRDLRTLRKITQDFLTPTLRASPGANPAVNQQYREAFNLVDRFNLLVAQVKYKPRITSDHHRLLVSVIEICLANCFVLFLEERAKLGYNNSGQKMKNFGKKLCEDICAKFILQ
jgi:hypothetical protein